MDNLPANETGRILIYQNERGDTKIKVRKAEQEYQRYDKTRRWQDTGIDRLESEAKSLSKKP